jgi:glycosyltransferase involved in cell wall biosynthesis
VHVATGDVAGLAAAIDALLADPARARDLAGRARRRVEERFSFGDRVRRMEDLYEALTGPAR